MLRKTAFGLMNGGGHAMMRLRIEESLQVPGKGWVLLLRGDCSEIRIGSVLRYRNGREITVGGIAMMPLGTYVDSVDILVREEEAPPCEEVYLKR